jgi:prepilin-type N-terminal cleavage/methylation domain-containing protein/prepilin-type processing-associated H-X9-DG protein
MSKRRETWASAFTLIELLVVVAIIGLLISILLPSLSRAKKQARTLVCTTNLREQGRAAFYYSEVNRGVVGRGIQGVATNDGIPEYHIYATTVLEFLGYDGRFGKTYALTEQDNRMRAVFRDTPQFQCPDYPTEDKPQTIGTATGAGTSVMDYVASALPIPYTRHNVEADGDASLPPGQEYLGVGIGTVDYISSSKLDDLALVKNPAETIYVTESHVSLRWDDYRFHHFFLTSHLPFGHHPRIASDLRHPGGIDALFFDGHAETMYPVKVDAGWGNSVGIRLRWFSKLADDVPASAW